MEKNISTIIFDFGNVLMDLDIPGFHDRMEELTGLNQADEMTKLDFHALAYEQGQIGTELFINQVIRVSKRSVQAREIIDCWNSMLLGIQPRTLHLLRDLKTHYRTFILSNTNPLHIEWVYQHLRTVHGIVDFENEFLNGAFYSHQLNMIKPDPEIYFQVQKQVATPADQILFLDDLERNVLAAREAGWNAVVHPPGTDLESTLSDYISIPQVKHDGTG